MQWEVRAARDTQNDMVKSAQVTLTKEQQHRPYLVDGYLPADEKLRTCPYCFNPTLDEPNTNQANRQSNFDTMAAYYKMQNELNEKGTTIGKKGKETMRVSKPKLPRPQVLP